MYANIIDNKIVGITSMGLKGLVEVPDNASINDYFVEGNLHIPPSKYSILIKIKNGSPVWEEDVSAKNAEADSLRLDAYRKEADPLFFKEQAGEVPKGTHQAKREEIKARYPKN